MVAEVADPKLKILLEEVLANKEPLVVFGVDGVKVGDFSSFAAVDCPNKEGAEVEAVVVLPKEKGEPVEVGLD